MSITAPPSSLLSSSSPSSWHQLVSGTSIAIDGQAVLLTGVSGSGKSDLALRLIDGGAALIADDVTELYRDGAHLLTRFPREAPIDLRGRLEVRGLGIMPVRHVEMSLPLILVAELVTSAAIQRMPEPALAKYDGFSVALVQLAPFELSAAAKLRLAVAAAAGHIMAPL